MTIQILNKDDQSKIVATSYVISPFTAIKEIIDNSIDAGAHNIRIEIDSKTGGCEYISVKDDGCGIDAADIPLVCIRGSTSKITQFSEIQTAKTLGFRGNALNSISNIMGSKGSLEFQSKTSGDIIGQRWLVDKNGVVKDEKVSKINCAIGTTVIIRKLLASLHVRYIEYSKHSKTTIDDVKTLLHHYSTIFDEIRFQFFMVSLNRDGSVLERRLQVTTEPGISNCRKILKLIGIKAINKDILIVKENVRLNNDISVNLILPNPECANEILLSKKKCKFLTVNNRIMSLKLSFGKDLTKALNSAYKDSNYTLPKCWLVSFTIDPNVIDINIEPEKNDILLRQSGMIIDELKILIKSFIEEWAASGEDTAVLSRASNTTLTNREKTFDNNKLIEIIVTDADPVNLLTDQRESERLDKKPDLTNDTVAAYSKHKISASKVEHKANTEDKSLCNSEDKLQNLDQNKNADLITKDKTFQENDVPNNAFKSINKLSNDSCTKSNTRIIDNNSKAYINTNSTNSAVGLNYPSTTKNSNLKERFNNLNQISSVASTVNKKVTKKLSMFSEYTNSYVMPYQFHKSSTIYKGYKNEIMWLMRNKNVNEYLKELLDETTKRLKIKQGILEKSGNGWYIYTEEKL
ncbi:hypothetical protein Kpol_1025p8 [Vanderwaltozyma polyspora DSM 70294]|uniref:DNA mismatch repair protein S5 domain-containing protein n=1 Tax=Vanderwaltozyma polyspora (strain ATCC 22028 / DSM 70294 / BCRC 21397 / CBS 2163 / NBRC 10782 / NRRL Y-8283 / UCD 57-17) TaxID=436907 RepID=A7TKT4_VANPO|nr:uncharacterized protein Kpol_1025p8 [Vanderwaltozyma polyspora DSM 70294]EDO17089.1 hypothetical protein Kpol_1025p8 [Vanderwaltozyma polyspora DSM 70294]